MLKPIIRVIAFVLILCAVLVLPAQSQDNPFNVISGIDLGSGALVTLETFDVADAWEHYSNPMEVELGVANGVYRAYSMNGGYVCFQG